MKLTNTTCKNAKPKEKPYKLTDGAGMFLYVMPNGSKYWRLKYRFGGKEKRLAMGVYPEITLQMAREKRLEARRLIDQGINPGQEKKKRKLQREMDTNNTFKVIAEEWVKHNALTWSDNHANTVRRRVPEPQNHVVTSRPEAEPIVTKEDCEKALDLLLPCPRQHSYHLHSRRV